MNVSRETNGDACLSVIHSWSAEPTFLSVYSVLGLVITGNEISRIRVSGEKAPGTDKVECLLFSFSQSVDNFVNVSRETNGEVCLSVIHSWSAEPTFFIGL